MNGRTLSMKPNSIIILMVKLVSCCDCRCGRPYNEAGNCNWDEVENLKIKKFNEYYQKSCLIFDGNGLKKDIGRGGEFIWERACLLKEII
jgi:hypothetical protein